MPVRTVYQYDNGVVRSGTSCSNCGKSYAWCTTNLFKGRKGACCPRCQYTDTHNEMEEERMTNPVKDKLRAQLAATQKELEQLNKIPDKDIYAPGTIALFELDVVDYRSKVVAVKTTQSTPRQPTVWMVSGIEGLHSWPSAINLVTHSGKYTVKSFKVGHMDEMTDKTVVPEPPVEVLTPEVSGYQGLVLHDRQRDLAWELVGTQWESRSRSE